MDSAVQRLPSALAAIGVQVGLVALLALSFEAVRHAGEEKETLLTLPPLARPAPQRAPTTIDMRGRPPRTGTVPPAPLPSWALPSFRLGGTQKNAPLAALRGDNARCRIENLGNLNPEERAACLTPDALARHELDLAPFSPDRPIRNAPAWQAEVDRKNAPASLPGASGGILGMLGTLLLDPGAYLDRRSYSYAPPDDAGKIDGAEMTHQAWSQIPQCNGLLDDTSRKNCAINSAAAPLLHLGGDVAPPAHHVSDAAFQQALAATQARTKSLYGKP